MRPNQDSDQSQHAQKEETFSIAFFVLILGLLTLYTAS